MEKPFSLTCARNGMLQLATFVYCLFQLELRLIAINIDPYTVIHTNRMCASVRVFVCMRCIMNSAACSVPHLKSIYQNIIKKKKMLTICKSN